jgi:hypothetical protein
MLWLIWIALILLVPIGAGVHVWWQLHRVSSVGPAELRLTQHPAQIATNNMDATQRH